MGDYYGKINAVEERGMHHIISLYKWAIDYGWTCEKLNDEYRAYLGLINADKYPRYVRSYLGGVRDTLNAQIQHTELEFCYTIDGLQYSTRKDSDMYYEKHDITPGQLHKRATHSGHYWIKTGNPYYVGKMNEK